MIKPSGVAYADMTEEDMVTVDLDGNVVAGERRPSTDTPTHLALYRAFEEIGGVVHTHSSWSVAWAQAQREIPLLGTTHADLCAFPIPVTRALTDDEIESDYEGATGTSLVELISERGPLELPCALVRGHAPFCWAADSRQGGRCRRHARAGGEDGAADHDARARCAAAAGGAARQAPRTQARPAGILRAAVTSENGLEQAEAKMREAGQPEEAIRAFASAYRRLESGDSAMLPSAELEPAGDVPTLEELPEVDGDALGRVAVIKLNGGLATSMGLRSPKSLIEARAGRSFLDIIIGNTLALRRRYGSSVAARADEQPGHARGNARTRSSPIPTSTPACRCTSSRAWSRSSTPSHSLPSAGRPIRPWSGVRPVTATCTARCAARGCSTR